MSYLKYVYLDTWEISSSETVRARATLLLYRNPIAVFGWYEDIKVTYSLYVDWSNDMIF